LDVLPQDLPRWLADLLVGRGKRIRVTMAYWAYISAGGVHGTPAYHRLLRVMAAVETLHLFALIHDDVMDESVSRRGKPSAHVQASTWHQQARGFGDSDLFGRNMAILLGDLAHTLADRLVEGLPTSLQEIWYELCFELIAGQRADLTGAAAGRRDKEHAEHVARLKSGRYTVVRPLQLGATAAGATDEIVTALMECGEHIGQAFALRDDYLGVWGDPELTGKPAGDDLLEAKATVVLALAKDRLRGGDAELLATVGTPSFHTDMVTHLSTAMRTAGVDTEVERLIAESFSIAMQRLGTVPLTSRGVEGLRSAAHAVAWRAA
jgi:geranylgeranyl pyrophosphate synthase